MKALFLFLICFNLFAGTTNIFQFDSTDRLLIKDENIASSTTNRGAIITESFVNNKVFQGSVFGISKRLNIAAGTNSNIVIDPTYYSGQTDKFVVFLPVKFECFGAGPIEIDLYFNANTNDSTGTEWIAANRDNTNTNGSNIVIRHDPTIFDSGIKLGPEWSVLSNGTAATAVAGGSATSDLPFILRLEGKYMFRLKNTDSTLANCTTALNWLEF